MFLVRRVSVRRLLPYVLAIAGDYCDELVLRTFTVMRLLLLSSFDVEVGCSAEVQV